MSDDIMKVSGITTFVDMNYSVEQSRWYSIGDVETTERGQVQLASISAKVVEGIAYVTLEYQPRATALVATSRFSLMTGIVHKST